MTSTRYGTAVMRSAKKLRRIRVAEARILSAVAAASPGT